MQKDILRTLFSSNVDKNASIMSVWALWTFLSRKLTSGAHAVSFHPEEQTVGWIMTDVTGNIAQCQEGCFNIWLAETYMQIAQFLWGRD